MRKWLVPQWLFLIPLAFCTGVGVFADDIVMWRVNQGDWTNEGAQTSPHTFSVIAVTGDTVTARVSNEAGSDAATTLITDPSEQQATITIEGTLNLLPTEDAAQACQDAALAAEQAIVDVGGDIVTCTTQGYEYTVTPVQVP